MKLRVVLVFLIVLSFSVFLSFNLDYEKECEIVYEDSNIKQYSTSLELEESLVNNDLVSVLINLDYEKYEVIKRNESALSKSSVNDYNLSIRNNGKKYHYEKNKEYLKKKISREETKRNRNKAGNSVGELLRSPIPGIVVISIGMFVIMLMLNFHTEFTSDDFKYHFFFSWTSCYFCVILQVQEHQNNINNLKVEASAKNLNAISFYKKNGFEDFNVTLTTKI